ncbi:hypothetical protein DE146DRAFT_753904 [Phaeosphaeria sp. MPI-PUGE-AT-0046c]|nr:hypothetical protein DE146DRAFT_753904 [Phaeosphaeria sp. MPI-PUGE-AT-0046c]
MHPSYTFLTVLSVSATALATPITITTTTNTMDHSRLEDLQCQCLSISADAFAKPTLCSALESHKLNWYTASSLAADHDLPIEYASQSTIARIAGIERVLPQNMLRSIEEEAVFKGEERPQGLVQVRNVIVCGFGDEVERVDAWEEEMVMAPAYHCIGYISACVMMVVMVYMLAEHAWSRFFAQGSIKLEGDEKALTAEAEAEEPSLETSDEKDGSSDFS